jgi:hypothetical protein
LILQGTLWKVCSGCGRRACDVVRLAAKSGNAWHLQTAIDRL